MCMKIEDQQIQLKTKMPIMEKRAQCQRHKLERKYIKDMEDQCEIICRKCALEGSTSSTQSIYPVLNENAIIFFKEWTRELFTKMDSACWQVSENSDIERMLAFSQNGRKILQLNNKKQLGQILLNTAQKQMQIYESNLNFIDGGSDLQYFSHPLFLKDLYKILAHSVQDNLQLFRNKIVTNMNDNLSSQTNNFTLDDVFFIQQITKYMEDVKKNLTRKIPYEKMIINISKSADSKQGSANQKNKISNNLKIKSQSDQDSTKKSEEIFQRKSLTPKKIEQNKESPETSDSWKEPSTANKKNDHQKYFSSENSTIKKNITEQHIKVSMQKPRTEIDGTIFKQNNNDQLQKFICQNKLLNKNNKYLREMLNQYEEKNLGLQKKIQKLQIQNQELEQKVRSFSKMEDSHEKISDIQKKIKVKMEKITKYMHQQPQKESIQKEKSIILQENERLKKKLEEIQKQHSAKLDQNEHLFMENKQLKEIIVELEEKMTQFDKNSRQWIRQLQKQIFDKEQKYGKIQQILESEKIQHQKIINNLKGEIIRLNKQVQEKGNKVLKYEHMIKEMEISHGNQYNFDEELLTECIELEAKVSGLEKDLYTIAKILNQILPQIQGIKKMQIEDKIMKEAKSMAKLLKIK